MTETSPNDLNNGHFGIPAYDRNDSQWAFARTTSGSGFRQLGHWTAILPAEVRFPTPNVPRTTLHTAEHATKAVLHDHPELTPAVDLIPELEAVSSAAVTATAAYDSTIGDLLSIGTVTPPKKAQGPPRLVAALPTGECGNILRLQMFVKERHGWKAEEKEPSLCHLEGPTLKGDFGFWNGGATVIQQVCFAQSEEPGSFLAVRLHGRIVLFHPANLNRRTAADPSRYYDLPPSVLDIRPFHSVLTGDTGGALHADVAFNPHYQFQFAVVDQDSGWSVWDIDGTRRTYHVKSAASGKMTLNEEIKSDEDVETPNSWKEDGWARIMWVGDANTIAICNRRRLELVDLKDTSRRPHLPQVVDTSSNHWILDMKRHPEEERHFFVLTSTRLYLFSVTEDGDALIVMSWTHFRGTEDVTLHLCIESIADEETAVFIHSRLNPLATVLHLTNQSSMDVPYCSFGPTDFRLVNSNNKSGSRIMLNFHLERLFFNESGYRGSGHVYEDQGIRFYQVSALFDDLSVAQTMVCILGPDSSGIALGDVEAPCWSKVLRYPKPTRITRGKVLDDDDDFLVPDGLIDTPSPLLKSIYGRLGARTYQESLDLARSSEDFSGLYTALKSSPAQSSENFDLSALIDEVAWRLDSRENVAPFTQGTLQEYAEAVVPVDDIDEASAKMQQLFLSERASSLELHRIGSDNVLGFADDEVLEPLSLSSLHDLLVQNWVAPLPRSIPARIRQSKERMARHISAGLLLASTRVRLSGNQANPMAPATRPGPSQDSAVALSSSLPQLSSQPYPLSSQPGLLSSQPNLLSQPTQLDSDPNSQDVLLSSNPSTTPHNPLDRLRKHLHIPPSETRDIPISIGKVISHWDLGTDPDTYDWLATEQGFVEEAERTQEGTQKRREKARRKKERLAQRQKRENELYTGKLGAAAVQSQPQVMRSSPGPAFGGSSQMPAQSQALSSQPFGGMLVQSQVEPGKHGGRPKKKKVKVRMHGF